MFCCCMFKRCLLLAGLVLIGTFSLCRRHVQNQTSDTVNWEDLNSESTRVIPQKIWQINPWEDRDVNGDYIQSWINKNPQHSYSLMSPPNADAFVLARYQHQPLIFSTFLGLEDPTLKSDLLRYLILAAEGGVYSDLDTEAIQPIKKWIPSGLEGRVRAVVGVQLDQNEGGRRRLGMLAPLQFSQWTFASTRNHPLIHKVIHSVVRSLNDLAREKETSLAGLDPSEEDILKTTGPAKWTNVVLEYLSETAGVDVKPDDFTNLHVPRIYGDLLILPLNSLSSGPPGSERDNAPMVRHYAKSLWKEDLKQKELDEIRPAARWSFPEVADRLKFLDAHR